MWKFFLGVALLIVFGLLLILVLTSVHWNEDVSFESSDCGWAESTLSFKGRDFRTILMEFELYKAEIGRSDVALIRVTERPWWTFLSSDPKWNVPYAPPSMVPEKSDLGFTKITPEEAEARADAAWEYWKNQ